MLKSALNFENQILGLSNILENFSIEADCTRWCYLCLRSRSCLHHRVDCSCFCSSIAGGLPADCVLRREVKSRLVKTYVLSRPPQDRVPRIRPRSSCQCPAVVLTRCRHDNATGTQTGTLQQQKIERLIVVVWL